MNKNKTARLVVGVLASAVVLQFLGACAPRTEYVYVYITPEATRQRSNSVFLDDDYEEYKRGYDDGFRMGEEEGYDDGFRMGEEEGYYDGRDAGYDQGYDDGFTEGEFQGYDQAYYEGFDDALYECGG